MQGSKVSWLQHVPRKMRSYVEALTAMTRFSWQQATRLPTGLHAEFMRHGIDALTIKPVQDPHQVSMTHSVLLIVPTLHDWYMPWHQCAWKAPPSVVSAA